jgi:RND family efflux transporter MFP subunit
MKIIAGIAIGLLIIAAVLIGVKLTSDSSDVPSEEMATMPPSDSTNTPTVPGRSGLAAADKNDDGIVYQSGMHPWIVQDEPGQCPICGMDLMPVRVDGMEEGTVRIDPVTIQNMGVRTARVTVKSLSRTVRTTGRFEVPEQGMTVVSPKISGWVEKLHVNYEGARVAKGEPLLEIYSPELVSTQEEYLLALRSLERMKDSPAAEDAHHLVEAARRRLGYWDISEAQIQQLEERGEPTKTLTLYAPAAGTVTATNVVEGQQVMAGQTLLRLANLSTLWLMVDVYEQDLSWVDIGTRASIELPYEAGRTLTGKVSYFYDQLNPETRTVQARVAVPNSGLKLKPGMYATVTLLGGETEARPVVPSEAIIRTGERDVVVIAIGEGRFRPVPVRVGVEADGQSQILEGLEGDEIVVTSAQFLIDSEARLASAVSAMIGGHDHGTDEAMQ